MIEVPHVIKYMGSKRSILEFVTSTIKENNLNNKRLYDIFGGSAVVSGALRNEMPVTCSDIQSYTEVLAKLYLQDYNWNTYEEDVLDRIVEKAEVKVKKALASFNNPCLFYNNAKSYEEVKQVEIASQELLETKLSYKDHLFAKYYSGTYWSFEQCVWIDALSSVAREKEYKNSFLSPVILSSLMFAMSYCSQSTGHYAQHRILTEQNNSDVLMYRQKNLLKLFKQKFLNLKALYSSENPAPFEHRYDVKDYLDILYEAEPNSIIYADPPYQFVHYSRFYHALETLIRYDYPTVKHKGRYRDDRHQSPFCISTKVGSAFGEMFKAISDKQSTLVLSYSDNGMISLEALMNLAKKTFTQDYSVSIEELDYKHSTMGRSGDKSRSVREVLLLVKPVIM
jgi:adenine-specific DNA-methyltransferase